MRRAAISLIVALILSSAALAARRGGQLEVLVVDRDTGKPLAARMHLKNAAKRPRKVPGAPFWHDHFVFDGKITLELPRGNYTFEVECGPEYAVRSGHFEINDDADDTKKVDMKRHVDMAAEGWWAGDLHVRRPLKDLPLLMRAENLHVVHVVTWDNRHRLDRTKQTAGGPLVVLQDRRCYHTLGGVDRRAGGSLLMLGGTAPVDLSGATAEFPSSLHYARAAKKAGAWIDAERIFDWDLPVWAAHGLLASVQIANSHMHRGGVIAHEAKGKARDKLPYPGTHGNARWAQQIYFHLLNCGLRLPPSAGSASGLVPNPVGYNRVYVFCGQDFSYQRWMKGLAAGQVVVTNGPLLRPLVEGQLPGHVFDAEAGQTLKLEIALSLATRDKIDYLEIIKNGRVVHEVPLREWAKNKGRLPPVSFKQSGWFLVRAVTNVHSTYRFAMTGPYYVEIAGKKRVSRASAKFFHDWVFERARRLKIADTKQRKEVIAEHRAARDYFARLMDRANAE